MSRLSELFAEFGTDKNSVHSYGPAYEELFCEWRSDPIKLLEIGIKDGGSLRAWREYFSSGEIHGLDMSPETMIVGESRIQTHCCRQDDSRALYEIGKRHGPFQLIVDDGSHQLVDIMASYLVLRGFLADGGIYVIEDLQDFSWTGYFQTPDFQIVDLRHVKNRYDDILVVARKS